MIHDKLVLMGKTITDKIRNIAKLYELKLVVLFGSRAEGIAGSGSDYDLALYGRDCLSEAAMVALQKEFSDALGNDMVDIIDLKKAPPLLKKKVFEHYVVLYEEDRLLKFQLELTAQAEFEECRDLYEMRRERLEEFVTGA